MESFRCIKPSFCVIGREGSTDDGPDFIRRLWAEANAHFSEIAELALRDGNGQLTGLWGAMSDPQRRFLPWTDHFSNGLYLAGVEALPDAAPPPGWTRWQVPGYEYLCLKAQGPDGFSAALSLLEQQHLSLVGAANDFTDPVTGIDYLYLPIRLL